MTTPTQGSNPLQYQIESVAKQLPAGAQEDFRQLAQALVNNVQKANPGGQFIAPGGAKTNSGTPPTGVGFAVAGANGAFQASITNPTGPTAQGQSLWHEISFSPLKSFTGNPSPTVLPPTQATSVTIPAPGETHFLRVRSSYDLTNWSPYQLASTSPISAGLVSSAATESAAAFNQTNLGVVNSTAVGSTAVVTVAGAAAALSSVPTVKGTAQSVTPAATIIGADPGSTQYVGYDQNSKEYVMGDTLPDVFDDSITPIGKVSVVGTGTPTLPTIVPIVTSGGVLGFNVTNGGAGASQDYVLTFTDFGSGTGATFGAQTIVGGVLTAVAPGNAGMNYPNSTAVTASGGGGGGTPGGGTAQGTTDGRLTT
jgi:hypothetical protein